MGYREADRQHAGGEPNDFGVVSCCASHCRGIEISDRTPACFEAAVEQRTYQSARLLLYARRLSRGKRLPARAWPAQSRGAGPRVTRNCFPRYSLARHTTDVCRLTAKFLWRAFRLEVGRVQGPLLSQSRFTTLRHESAHVSFWELRSRTHLERRYGAIRNSSQYEQLPLSRHRSAHAEGRADLGGLSFRPSGKYYLSRRAGMDLFSFSHVTYDCFYPALRSRISRAQIFRRKSDATAGESSTTAPGFARNSSTLR